MGISTPCTSQGRNANKITPINNTAKERIIYTIRIKEKVFLNSSVSLVAIGLCIFINKLLHIPPSTADSRPKISVRNVYRPTYSMPIFFIKTVLNTKDKTIEINAKIIPVIEESNTRAFRELLISFEIFI